MDEPKQENVEKSEVTNSESVNEQENKEVKPTAEELLKNREAELERKNRELERMRSELAMRHNEPVKRDPNDISTWSDHELKAIINSNDPSTMPFKDKANDILLDRKVDARLSRQAETNKRVTAEMQLREKFPEALDPSSELAVRMEQLIAENDLSRTPAGRLVAAKLASAELNQGKNSSDAQGRKNEANRVNRVKSQMVDGDRPKPTNNDANLDQKKKDLSEKLIDGNKKGKEQASTEAMSELLKDRFGGRDSFFSRKYK